MSHDVLVVGGGLVGLLTARYLEMQGFDVALIEKNQVGCEASWAAGGILSKLYPWQQSVTAQKLIAQGQSSFPALVKDLLVETGIDAQLLHCGMMILDIDEQQEALDWSKNNNFQIQTIGRDEIDRLEPYLHKEIEVALHAPATMQVRPPQLINAVHQSLIKRGVQVLEGKTVNKLIVQSNKVIGIETDQKTMHADHVIICNGAWAQHLLDKISSHDTDIQPVRGQMLLFKTKQNLLSKIIVKNGIYLIPRKDQFILCGSTVERVGFDSATTQEAKELLSHQAYEVCPMLKDEEVVKHWSALRPGTQREVPYVCAHPDYEGLYINAGHFRYGIVMSNPTARMASELIANKVTASQLSAYAW